MMLPLSNPCHVITNLPLRPGRTAGPLSSPEVTEVSCVIPFIRAELKLRKNLMEKLKKAMPTCNSRPCEYAFPPD